MTMDYIINTATVLNLLSNFCCQDDSESRLDAMDSSVANIPCDNVGTQI